MDDRLSREVMINRLGFGTSAYHSLVEFFSTFSEIQARSDSSECFYVGASHTLKLYKTKFEGRGLS